MASINFVRQRIRKLNKLEKKDKKIFKIVAITAAVLLIFLAIVLGIKIYLTTQIKGLQSSQQAFLRRIELQEDKEKSFILFVSKLRTLSGVFQDRPDKQDAISYFTQIFGPDVTIEKIAFDAESQLLVFRLMSANIFTLQQVFDVLSSEATAEKFSSLTKGSLQRTGKGIYQMEISVVVGEIDEVKK